MSKFSEVKLLESSAKDSHNRIKILPKRDIKAKLFASQRDRRFFDGSRIYGYGGYNYDGRLKTFATKISQKYFISDTSSVIQIQCEKGFLLHELSILNPNCQILGLETSAYAIKNSLPSIRNKILYFKDRNFSNLPFLDKSVDLIISLGFLYTLNLKDLQTNLLEIQRVGKKSFITLATYENSEDLELFRKWSLLGTLFYTKKEWGLILKSVNYSGDVQFISASFLGLC